MNDEDEKKPKPPIPFDFSEVSRYRLPPGSSGHKATEILVRIPAEKTNSSEYFRTPQDPEMWVPTLVYKDRETRQAYFVDPDMEQYLAGEARPNLIIPTLTRQGVLRLWPVTEPLETGRQNGWFETAREAAELAKTHWVRIAADMALGGYRIYKAEGNIPDPEWPKYKQPELFAIAFKELIIATPDHPVVRKLRGLV